MKFLKKKILNVFGPSCNLGSSKIHFKRFFQKSLHKIKCLLFGYGEFWGIHLLFCLKKCCIFKMCAFFPIPKMVPRLLTPSNSFLHKISYIMKFFYTHTDAAATTACSKNKNDGNIPLFSKKNINKLRRSQKPTSPWKPLHKKTQSYPTVFALSVRLFFPSECPGLCWHRSGHSLGGKSNW